MTEYYLRGWTNYCNKQDVAKARKAVKCKERYAPDAISVSRHEDGSYTIWYLTTDKTHYGPTQWKGPVDDQRNNSCGLQKSAE